MFKKRLIAVLIVKSGRVVQSVGFRRYLPVGTIEVCAQALNRWGIDEIVLLDIDASREGRKTDLHAVRAVSKNCFVPVMAGGGITELPDIVRAIHAGADKICVNRAALERPELLTEGAKAFGKQCIVVAMDVLRGADGKTEVMNENGRKGTGKSAVDWAREAEERGAGEVLLQAVHRDGSKQGYDIELLKEVSSAVSVPVIALGGAGHPQHFLEAFTQTDICAAAAGNYFHFTEHSPIVTKAYLTKRGVNVRTDTEAVYAEASFGPQGRIEKYPDETLRRLRFIQVHEEKL